MRAFTIVALLAATLMRWQTVRAASEPQLPTPNHVVVAILENHAFAQIIGNDRAPFINELARDGASFARSFAVGHPSQPNYFALFSGSTQGVGSDAPRFFQAPTLAGQLRAAGKTFVGYVESGSPRKHNPWASFADARDAGRDLSQFPTDFTTLPTVSFVIPNLDDDMHDGSVERGDAWLRQKLGAYAAWCRKSDDILIVTFDEDDGSEGNRIATVFFGASVAPGRYERRIDHYSVLRTIEALERLPPLGFAAQREPISGVWRQP
jgi:acid phosphatase